MAQLIKRTGIIKYDPVRRDLKKTHKSRTMIIDFPRDEFSDFYQWLLRKKLGEKFAMQSPLYGTHVTVVRGDEPGWKSPSWKKHEGEKIDVYYSPELECTWKFWSLPVAGDGLFELRRELGLKAFHDFHITVARGYDWQVFS